MNDADINELAGEFVLGALPPEERSAVVARLHNDEKLAAAVARWERRLAPLSHREPGIAPPAHALEGILAGLAHRGMRGHHVSAEVSLRRQVGMWRWVATGMAAIAAALAIALGSLHFNSQLARSGTLVAVLVKGPHNAAADEPGVSMNPVFLATIEAQSRVLSVRQVSGRPPPTGKRYALWIVEEIGTHTTLLGIISTGEPTTDFNLANRPTESIMVSSLVVSLESPGPAGVPKGPIISVGKLSGTWK